MGALIVFVILLLLTLFTIVYERKVVARMAVRPGPNQVGPNGWLQSLTDGMKLPFKEEIIPITADKVVYFIAPVISATTAFTAFSVIPFGPVVSIRGHHTALQLTDEEDRGLADLGLSPRDLAGFPQANLDEAQMTTPVVARGAKTTTVTVSERTSLPNGSLTNTR